MDDLSKNFDEIENYIKGEGDEYSLDEVCRTCCTSTISFQNKLVLIPIFQDELNNDSFRNIKIAEELKNTLKLEVKKDDGLPQKICFDCFKQIENIDKFRQECGKSQEKLRSLFKGLISKHLFEHIIIGDVINIKNENDSDENGETNITITDQTNNISNCNNENKSVKKHVSKINSKWKKIKEENIEDSDNSDSSNEPLIKKLKDKKGTFKKSRLKKTKFEISNNLSQLISQCHKCKKYCHSSRMESHVTRSCSYLLKRSKKTNVLDAEFCCCFCDELFKTIQVLEDHLINFHSVQRPHTCVTCKKNFASQAKLRIHTKIHNKTSKTLFKCNICEEEFDVRANYIFHRKTAHVDGEEYSCTSCPKKFTTSDKLHNHLKIHDDTLKKNVCDECGKAFLRPYLLKYHKRNHTNERPFICDKCGYSLKSHSSLRHHLKSHEKIYTPSLLNRVQYLAATGNPDNYHWKRKIKTSETTEEEIKKYSFTCPICSQMFRVSSGLEKHMNLHDANRKYPCNQCNFSFNSSAHLRRHIYRTHSNDKPHVCKYCSRGFRDPGTKNDHEKLHFEKKVQCRYCEKLICEKYIKVHERTHTGEKPCICQICGKSFTYTLALARHHSKVHTLEDSERLKAQILADNPTVLIDAL